MLKRKEKNEYFYVDGKFNKVIHEERPKRTLKESGKYETRFPCIITETQDFHPVQVSSFYIYLGFSSQRTQGPFITFDLALVFKYSEQRYGQKYTLLKVNYKRKRGLNKRCYAGGGGNPCFMLMSGKCSHISGPYKLPLEKWQLRKELGYLFC